MAIPLIPIILGAIALGSSVIGGISSVQNSKAQAKAVALQTEDKINERARQAKKLMQQQKTSFLKSGVYFDSGSPLAVINETYDTMKKDTDAMYHDGNTQIKNLMREGKTAFYGSIAKGIADAGMAFVTAGGSTALKSGSGLMSTISNSKAGIGFQNWYNSARGLTRGGFSNLPTKNIV